MVLILFIRKASEIMLNLIQNPLHRRAYYLAMRYL